MKPVLCLFLRTKRFKSVAGFMFSLIKELFSVLDTKQRHRLYRLQILVILMAGAEILSVAAIGPFMLLLVNIEQIDKFEQLQTIYLLSGAASPTEFVLYAGCTTVCILLLTSCISIFTVWQLSMFSTQTGAELSNRLFSYYLSKNWLYHTQNDNAKLSSKINADTTRVTTQILQPLMNLNAKILMALGISAGVFFMDPAVALAGLSLFLIAYSLIYLSVKQRLYRNSQFIFKANPLRFRKQMEGLGGIREILLLHREQLVIDQFKKYNHQIAESTGQNNALSISPRYFMEFISISAVVSLVVLLSIKHDGNLGNVLPVLAIYGLAGLKLLPAFQQCYHNISTIKGAIASFHSVKDDLKASLSRAIKTKADSPLEFTQQISLESIFFSYSQENQNVLDNISLTIKKNQSVAFVGPSGSGKSTLIDVISGLIAPESGNIFIDGNRLSQNNMQSWQGKIGFVSQAIFLVGGTLRQNIAFGLPEQDIDDDKVNRAIALANLSDFVDSLEEKTYFKVGERGNKLSGGQRQRVGIARALYHDPDILIFDEATSALDGITEKIIMDTIQAFSGNKTIITIAHRLTTVQHCDTIFMIDKGSIVDQGEYQTLLKTNKTFSAMAKPETA